MRNDFGAIFDGMSAESFLGLVLVLGAIVALACSVSDLRLIIVGIILFILGGALIWSAPDWKDWFTSSNREE